MSDISRTMEPTKGYFTTRDAIAPERLASVEGVKPKGKVEVRRIMVGNEILMLHVLREKGLIFTGIDVIDGWLTEINVTSPTGLQELDRFDGTNAAEKIWQVIEAKRGL